MRTLVTFGESLIDSVSSVPGTLVEVPSFKKAAGGAPAAVAACVAHLGGRSAFIRKRGIDAFGDFLLKTLQECGVDIRFFYPTDKVKIALSFVSPDQNGERSFTFYRDPSADTFILAKINNSLRK
jgi:fructokinase